MYSPEYKDILALATLRKVESIPAIYDREYNEQGEVISETLVTPATYVLEIDPKPPFDLKYSSEIWHKGKQVSLSDITLDGCEVLIRCSVIDEHLTPGFIPSEYAAACAWENTLKNEDGEVISNWSMAEAHPKVTEHYGQYEQIQTGQDEEGNPIYEYSTRLRKPGEWF
jgi:hypothetical protein